MRDMRVFMHNFVVDLVALFLGNLTRAPDRGRVWLSTRVASRRIVVLIMLRVSRDAIYVFEQDQF